MKNIWTTQARFSQRCASFFMICWRTWGTSKNKCFKFQHTFYFSILKSLRKWAIGSDWMQLVEVFVYKCWSKASSIGFFFHDKSDICLEFAWKRTSWASHHPSQLEIGSNIPVRCWVDKKRWLRNPNHQLMVYPIIDPVIDTWWLIPVSKWVTTLVISGISGGKSSTYTWGELTHLRSVGWTTK